MLSEMNRTPETASTKTEPPRVVVIGMGNLLLKDEGIGIDVAHALQKLDLPQGIGQVVQSPVEVL